MADEERLDDLCLQNFRDDDIERYRLFSQKYPEHTLIAIDDLKVVGFISYGNFRDETIQAGEIIALYVLKTIMERIAQKLVESSFDCS